MINIDFLNVILPKTILHFLTMCKIVSEFTKYCEYFISYIHHRILHRILFLKNNIPSLCRCRHFPEALARSPWFSFLAETSTKCFLLPGVCAQPRLRNERKWLSYFNDEFSKFNMLYWWNVFIFIQIAGKFRACVISKHKCLHLY